MIYSFVEFAKANKLEPYKYLRYLFEKLPFTKTTEDYKMLMHGNLTPEIFEGVPQVSCV